jgi:hypothetical protein
MALAAVVVVMIIKSERLSSVQFLSRKEPDELAMSIFFIIAILLLQLLNVN